MSDDTKPNDPQPPDGGDRLAFLEAEAKKAFAARDELKRKVRELESAGLTPQEREEYQALKANADKAEEDRKRKAGEFDTWRQSITDKHAKELGAATEKAAAAEKRLRDTLIGRAFADATDLFGREAATIYQPYVAEKVFGQYVDLDEHGQPVVKDAEGHVIVDAKTGRPASFPAAMRELIDGLPDRDYHLRGSGKTGSGNSGGAEAGKPTDLKALTLRAQQGDVKAAQELRQRLASKGGMEVGSGFARARAARTGT